MTLRAALETTGTEEVPDCIICGRAGTPDGKWADLLALPSRYGVRRCRRCDLRWLSPRPAPDALQVIYSREFYFEQGDAGFAQFASRRVEHFRARIARLRSLGVSSVLDYGAATGDFVALAREAGLSAEGIELSDEARSQAREARGLRLHAPADAPGGPFDAVHTNHVFEHVPDPVAHLQWCAGRLHGDGLLVLEVPNQFDNDLDRLRRLIGKGGRSACFDAFSVHHTYFYSRRSLERLCEAGGFRAVELSAPQTPATGLSWKRRLVGAVLDLRGNGDVLYLEARRA